MPRGVADRGECDTGRAEASPGGPSADGIRVPDSVPQSLGVGGGATLWASWMPLVYCSSLPLWGGGRTLRVPHSSARECISCPYKESRPKAAPGSPQCGDPKVGPTSAQTLSGTLEAPQTWASSPTPRRLTLL